MGVGDSPVRRFRARVATQGPNPYVDVPPRVTEAFAPWARAGRVTVVGSVRGVEVRATLVPVGSGRQRLFVNGGMRAATGVQVGDEVTFTLWVTQPDEVVVPADVATGLAGEPGAREAFDALPPSHRRELLRHVDDARTPQTRARRIAQTVDHVLDRTPPKQTRTDRSLWTCPDCGQAFVTRNASHSCRRWTVEELLDGVPQNVRTLLDRFTAMVEACGPVTVFPSRDRMTYMVRVRFAGATPRRRWLDVALWLRRRVESPRWRKVETIYPDAHVHVLRVTRVDDLDEETGGWVREAYAVGCQEGTPTRPGGPG